MYKHDPRWITARFTSSCAECGATIKRGEQAFYYPKTKRVFGSVCECGDERSRQFEAERFDEDFMSQ